MATNKYLDFLGGSIERGALSKRATLNNLLLQEASKSGSTSYHDINAALAIDPDTGLQLDREIYDEAIKLWSPDSGIDGFYEGTLAHRLTPAMVKKAKATVYSRREKTAIETKERDILNQYMSLIKESPNTMRGQTLLTSGRQGSNSILGSPIDPMKTVLT